VPKDLAEAAARSRRGSGSDLEVAVNRSRVGVGFRGGPRRVLG